MRYCVLCGESEAQPHLRSCLKYTPPRSEAEIVKAELTIVIDALKREVQRLKEGRSLKVEQLEKENKILQEELQYLRHRGEKYWTDEDGSMDILICDGLIEVKD